ncbi:MAG TPA: DUF393 domain-containing protein [Pseudobdellovibrionaceae bacterium]
MKRAFPSYSEFEPYKFALLRILFGAVLVLRALYIQKLLIPEEWFSPIGIYSLMGLTAAILLTCGLFTQWSLLFLIFFMWHTGDGLLGTSTLGNDVAAMLGLLLFLTNAGAYLSMDSLLLNQFRWARKVLLYLEDVTSPRKIALAKFITLLAYACVCVYSLSMHLNEPAWTSGNAGPLLFTNNFMSSWHQFAEALFVQSEFSVHLARISLWTMILWFISVIPFTLLGGIFRLYTITWGVLFFLLALIVLNLGSLAQIELVFWAAIFWSKRGLDVQKKLVLFFDDKCNLCDKLVQVLSFLDLFGRMKFSPLSQSASSLKNFNIHLEEALIDLYGGVEASGEVQSGYDLYVLLSRNLVLLWPLFPVFYLGKLLKIGPLLYRFVARRRREIFGVCSLSRPKIFRPSLEVSSKRGFLHSAIFLHVFLLAGGYLVAIPAPYIGIEGSPNVVQKAAHYYGITPINVFNSGDLRMAENWFTLNSIDNKELVPLFTEFGSRLDMHISDRVYFGNTLRFRRGVIGDNQCAFEKMRPSIEYLSKVYLHLKSAPSGEYTFKYDQYYQALPADEELFRGKYRVQPKEVKCNTLFKVSYNS